MAFSFNWAGLVAPRVDTIRDELDLTAMGQALGKGLRGYRDRQGMEEYAGMISSGHANADEIASIQAEISRLEQRNAELQKLMSGQPAAQPVVQANTVYGV